MSDHQQHGSDAGSGKRQEQYKPAQTKLSEDQQVPVGLDNPFWKKDRDEQSL